MTYPHNEKCITRDVILVFTRFWWVFTFFVWFFVWIDGECARNTTVGVMGVFIQVGGQKFDFLRGDTILDWYEGGLLAAWSNLFFHGSRWVLMLFIWFFEGINGGDACNTPVWVILQVIQVLGLIGICLWEWYIFLCHFTRLKITGNLQWVRAYHILLEYNANIRHY